MNEAALKTRAVQIGKQVSAHGLYEGELGSEQLEVLEGLRVDWEVAFNEHLATLSSEQQQQARRKWARWERRFRLCRD